MVDIDTIRAYAQAELERWQVPAVEVVAIRDGDVLLAEAFGLRDVSAGLPASPLTLFHHGSTGKAFTGVLAGTLVDAGLLEWDRPVREYLPNFRLHDSLLGDRVTAADLLSHRSGLARHELAWVANPSLDRGELVRRLRYLPSNNDLRTSFVYSNLAFVTVGHLIGVLTGSTWEDQMRERVLQPLGMDHTTTSVSAAQEVEHAQPYVRRSDEAGAEPPGPESENGRSKGSQWTPIPWRASDQIAPAGGIISCALDMTCWLQLQLSDGEVGGTRIISAESLEMTRHLHTPIDAPGQDPVIRFYGYAYGWLIGTFRGRRLAWHNGGIDGFKTEIAILPDDNIAVAASCNVLDTDLPLSLIFHMADTLIGEEPKPWSETFLAARQDSSQPTEPESVAGTQPSHPLEAYAGDYIHPGYGTLRVTQDGTKLRVRLCELDLRACYRHYDTWTVTYEPLDITVAMTFITNEDGNVCAAELPLESSVAPIRFNLETEETNG